MLELNVIAAAAVLGHPDSPRLAELLVRESLPQLIIAGPHGMGHSAALSSLGATLRADGHEVLHVDCRNPRAADQLSMAAETNAVLLHQGEFASLEVLTLIAGRIQSRSAPVVVAWDDGDLGAGANQRIDLLRERDYELAMAIRSLRLVPLEQWSDQRIDGLVHLHFPRHPDTLTVRAVRKLAAGRPLWAVELTRLAADGLVHSRPRAAISRLDPARWNTTTMKEIQGCVGELSDHASAAALALCSLESVAQVSATQVFGASAIDLLLSRNLLVVVDESRGLLSPVVMLIEPLRQRTPNVAVSRAEDALAAHLLAMSELGVALSETELRFCAAQIAVAMAPEADSPELLATRPESRSKVLLRAATLAADFGRHDTARSLQVAAMRLSGTKDPVELVRAIAGRDDPFTALSRLSGDDIAGADQYTVSYLAGLLRTEAGMGGPESPDDHVFLLDVWNRQDKLDGSLARVQKLAQVPSTDLRLRLLADTLMLLASAASGLLPDPRVHSRARLTFEALSSPGVSPSALNRDAQSTYLLTLAIAELLTTGRVHSESFRDVAQRMTWPDSHLTWLRLLENATLALAVGDVGRADTEWSLLLEFMPRFAATRIAQAFRSMQPLITSRGVGSQDPTLNNGYIGLIVAHWAGDHAAAATMLTPAPTDLARLTPLSRAIREAVGGQKGQNPNQLMRAAESLHALGQWASALTALEVAREILIRRRSSGAMVSCNALIEQTLASARASVTWSLNLDPAGRFDEASRLTVRESEIAGLAAEGCSNKDIASSLKLSVRTVESHLAQARAKLGVATRKQLAEHLRSTHSA